MPVAGFALIAGRTRRKLRRKEKNPRTLQNKNSVFMEPCLFFASSIVADWFRYSFLGNNELVRQE